MDGVRYVICLVLIEVSMEMLTCWARMQVWSYDPSVQEARLESGKTNRMLMRRYAVVEKAKDADVIGILVGTLGVGELISSISALSSSHPPTLFSSGLFATHFSSPEIDCFASKEIVHRGGRETESRQTRKLYGSRVFRSRRLSREYSHRFKGERASLQS